jgi:hypothetical protein
MVHLSEREKTLRHKFDAPAHALNLCVAGILEQCDMSQNMFLKQNYSKGNSGKINYVAVKTLHFQNNEIVTSTLLFCLIVFSILNNNFNVIFLFMIYVFMAYKGYCLIFSYITF